MGEDTSQILSIVRDDEEEQIGLSSPDDQFGMTLEVPAPVPTPPKEYTEQEYHLQQPTQRDEYEGLLDYHGQQLRVMQVEDKAFLDLHIAPEMYARAFDIAQYMQVDIATVMSELEVWEHKAAQSGKDYASSDPRNHPLLMEAMTDDEILRRLGWDDRDVLGKLAQNFDSGRALAAGLAQMDLAELTGRAMSNGGELSFEDLMLEREYQQLSIIPEKHELGWIAEQYEGAVQLGPFMGEVLLAGAAGRAAGAATGFAYGSFTGPGAVGFAALGGTIGQYGGAFLRAADLETKLAYRGYRAAGMDHDTAMRNSQFYGIIAGAIELAPLALMLHTGVAFSRWAAATAFPIKGVRYSRVLFRKGVEAAIKSAPRQVGNQLARAVKLGIATSIVEVIEEGGQGAAQELFRQIGAPDEEINLGIVLSAGIEESIAVAGPIAAMSTVTAGLGGIIGLSAMGAGMVHSRHLSERLDRGVQAAIKSKTRGRSTGIFQQYIEKFVGKGDTVQIPVARLQEMYHTDEEGNVSESAAVADEFLDNTPGAREQYNKAQVTGSNIVVSTAEFLSRITEPMWSQISEDVIPGEGAMALKEQVLAIDEFEARIAQMEETQEEIEKGNTPASQIYEHAIELGYPQQHAVMLAHSSIATATDRGVDPVEYAKQNIPRLYQPGEEITVDFSAEDVAHYKAVAAALRTGGEQKLPGTQESTASMFHQLAQDRGLTIEEFLALGDDEILSAVAAELFKYQQSELAAQAHFTRENREEMIAGLRGEIAKSTDPAYKRQLQEIIDAHENAIAAMRAPTPRTAEGVGERAQAERNLMDEPLGVSREPVLDMNLASMDDSGFEASRIEANRKVDDLERQMDDNPGIEDSDMGFRAKLIKAQDDYDSYRLEDFRRKHADAEPEDIAYAIRNLGDSKEDKVKALLLSDIVARRNISDELRPFLEEYASRSPDHAEVLGSQLDRFAKTVSEAGAEGSAPRALAEARKIGLLPATVEEAGTIKEGFVDAQGNFYSIEQAAALVNARYKVGSEDLADDDFLAHDGFTGLDVDSNIPDGWADRLKNKLRRSKLKGSKRQGWWKNSRRTFTLANGSQITVGRMRPQDWAARIASLNLNPVQIKEWRNWYKDVIGAFTVLFGEQAPHFAAAWLMAQQQASPKEAFRNMLRAREMVYTGIDTGVKAGLAHDRLVAFWQKVLEAEKRTGRVSAIEFGAQKLNDFVDSALGKLTRRWMGNDPAGGQPAVIDVWTARDVGFVDDTLVDLLRRAGVSERKLARLVIDQKSGAAPSQPQYEHGAEFLHEVMDYLNANNLFGGNFTHVSEVQALGWMALLFQFNQPMGDVQSAIAGSRQALQAALMFGGGAPYNVKFAALVNLPYEYQEQATATIIPQIVAEAVAMLGHPTVEGTDTAAGIWGIYDAEPSSQITLIATDALTDLFADIVIILAQQTEVRIENSMDFTPSAGLPLGANSWFIDVLDPNGNLLTSEQQLALWEKIKQILPHFDEVTIQIKGKSLEDYQKVADRMEQYESEEAQRRGWRETSSSPTHVTYVLDAGLHLQHDVDASGIRIGISMEGKFRGAKVGRAAAESVRQQIEALVDSAVDVLASPGKARRRTNNWKEAPNGEESKARVEAAGGSDLLSKLDSARGRIEEQIAAAAERAEFEHNEALGDEARLAAEARSAAEAVDPELRSGERGGIGSAGEQVTSQNDLVRLIRKLYIRLTGRVNAATLFHELGHFYYAVLQQGGEQGLSEREVADWAIVKEWLGNNGERLTRDQSERLAKAFELYIHEGRAPSAGLRGVFSRFRIWMLSVYPTLRLFKGIELTDELREVMDRMLATNEQIRQARAHEDIGMAEEDAAQIFSAEELTVWRRARTRAIDAMANILDVKSLRIITRRRTGEYREALKKKRAEVRDRLSNEPAYLARAWLRTGMYIDGRPDDPMPHKRLSKEGLVELFGEDVLKQFPGLWQAENGYHPDEIAHLFGFDSGSDMITAMLSVPAMEAEIRAQVKKEMDIEFGDLLSDENIAEEVLAAKQNNAVAELLLLEERAIARRTGQKPTPHSLLREKAEADSRKLSLREMHAGRAREAQRRAAIQVAEALHAGDNAAMQAAKAREVYQFHLAREIDDRRRETDAALKRIRKIATLDVQKELGLPDGGQFLIQALRILNRFSFRSKSLVQIDAKPKTLSEWLDYYENVLEHDAPVSNLIREEEIFQIHYKNLTVQQLLDVDVALRYIRTMARKAREVEVGEIKANREEIENGLAADADANIKRKRRREGTPDDDDILHAHWKDRPKILLNWIDAVHQKMEVVAGWLAGAGAGVRPADLSSFWYKAITEPLQKMQEDREEMYGEYGSRLRAMIDVLTAKTKHKSTRKRYDELPDPENNGRGMFLNQWELVMILLHFGSVSNRKKMLEGYGWKYETVIDLLDRELSDEHFAFVQDVWNLYEELKAPAFALDREQYGVAPPAVKPLTVETPSGRKLKGGYMHIRYDPGRSKTGARNALKALDEKRVSGARRATTGQGHLQGRLRNFSAPIHLAPRLMLQHLEETITDITMRKTLDDVTRLLASDTVNAALKRNLGEHYTFERFWNPKLKNIAGDRRGTMDTSMAVMDTLLRGLRKNVTAAKLFLRSTVILIQPSGLSNSAATLTQYLGEGGEMLLVWGMNAALNPLKGGDYSFTLAEVDAMSRFMNTRTTNYNRDHRDVVLDAFKLGSGQSARIVKLHREWQQVAAMPIAEVQKRGVDYPTWLAAYRGARIIQGRNHGDAIIFADRMVRLSQGSGTPFDQTSLEMGGINKSEWVKMWFMFYSFRATAWTQRRTSYMGAGFKNFHHLLRSELEFTLIPAMYSTGMRSALFSLIGIGYGINWDDDDVDWSTYMLDVIKRIPGEMTGAFIGVETIFALAMGEDPRAGSAPLMAMEDIGRIHYAQDEVEAWLRAARAAATFFGIPGIDEPLKEIEKYRRAQSAPQP